MPSLNDMTFKRHSDSVRGSDFNAGVRPVFAPASTQANGALLSEQLAQTTPPLFGLRISRGSNKLFVNGGIIHNTWVNGTSFRLNGAGRRVWLTGLAVYPTDVYTDSSAVEHTYRKGGKKGPVRLTAGFTTRSVGEADPTPAASNVSDAPIFVFLGEARRPANDTERAASVNGWFLDAASTNQFTSPIAYVSALPLELYIP